MTSAPMNRRRALRRLAHAGATAAAAAAAPCAVGALNRMAAEFSVTVLLDEPIGTIRPALYSQFAEHIGGVIYDGIWVGPESKVAEHRRHPPAAGRARHASSDRSSCAGRAAASPTSTTGATASARAPAALAASADGARRPRPTSSAPMSSSASAGSAASSRTSPPTSGPARPRNSSSGSNTATHRPDRRRWPTSVRPTASASRSASATGASATRAGAAAASSSPRTIAASTAGSPTGCPQYGVPLYLIAAGPNGNDLDWTRRFFAKWVDGQRAPIQGWAPHYYCGTTGHALKFNQDQWYEQLHKANQMETLIKDQWAALGEFDPKHTVKLVIDEWGSWHPEGTEINKRHLFEQMGTLRDALVAALSLDTFNRHADKVDMANVAQLVNNLHSLFLADGDRFVATPTFHVYTMYRPHQGAKGVRIAVEAPEVTFQAGGREQRIFRAGGLGVAGRSQRRDPDPGSHPCDRAGRGRDPPARRRGRPGPPDGPDSHAVERPQHVRAAGRRGAQDDRPRRARSRAQVRLAAASVNRFDIRLG